MQLGGKPATKELSQRPATGQLSWMPASGQLSWRTASHKSVTQLLKSGSWSELGWRPYSTWPVDVGCRDALICPDHYMPSLLTVAHDRWGTRKITWSSRKLMGWFSFACHTALIALPRRAPLNTLEAHLLTPWWRRSLNSKVFQMTDAVSTSQVLLVFLHWWGDVHQTALMPSVIQAYSRLENYHCMWNHWVR